MPRFDYGGCGCGPGCGCPPCRAAYSGYGQIDCADTTALQGDARYSDEALACSLAGRLLLNIRSIQGSTHWYALPEPYRNILTVFPMNSPGYYLPWAMTEGIITGVPTDVLPGWAGYGSYGGQLATVGKNLAVIWGLTAVVLFGLFKTRKK